MGYQRRVHGEKTLTRSIVDFFLKDKILRMAFISVETRAEITMIKFLSSLNQILLLHCFTMIVLAGMFANTEHDVVEAFQEEEVDESILMERADAVSILLPCLAAVTLGAVATSGGSRVFGVFQ